MYKSFGVFIIIMVYALHHFLSSYVIAQWFVVNDCLNANYNEEVFKKYVNDLGYEFEITTKKDGLFR